MKPVKVARAPPNSASRIARMHAIGADQHIAAHALAVFEQQCHAVGVLFEVDAARADTHRVGRAFGQCLAPAR